MLRLMDIGRLAVSAQSPTKDYFKDKTDCIVHISFE
jgi:hypothetical protein